MTDDLVKRLRNNCSCNFSSTPCGAEEECRNAFEAASRIEKLEAALDDVSQYVPRADWYYLKPETLAALEGKDD